MEQYTRQDIQNMLNMACDQFNGGFAGRKEFIEMLINDYTAKLPPTPSPQEVPVGFEDAMEAEINKLPYTKHVDDGQYNDGQLAGFELGARWAAGRVFPTEGPWKVRVDHSPGHPESGCSGDTYIVLTDGRVELTFDGGIDDNDEQLLCDLLNARKINLDYDHEAELYATQMRGLYEECYGELKRVQEAQAGVLRPIKPLGDWLLAQKDLPPVMLPDGGYWYYGSVLQLLKRYLKESESPSLPAKGITGFNTMAEYEAYNKGRADEEKVILKFIEEWNGETNSEMGSLLASKLPAREQAVDPVAFAEWASGNRWRYLTGKKQWFHTPSKSYATSKWLIERYTQSLTNAHP
jgi:hypothetical protein